MKKYILGLGMLIAQAAFAQNNFLNPKLKSYVDQFNAIDTEAVKNLVPNDQAYEWLQKNAPLFECPDKEIEEVYYFRWWSFRKHLKQTPDGYIFTEFITPVKHAGKYNSISCALGHHIYEGRWLRNQEYIKQYIKFWLYEADKGQSKQRFHQFSSWIDDAVLAYYKVNPDKEFIREILPDLDKDYEKWEEQRQHEDGLFWQFDVKDGMEESVSGSRREENMRPTINSYMYGNAKALAELAAIAGRDDLVNKYQAKAKKMKALVQDSLWNSESNFFETRMHKGDTLANVREAIGFIPWYFNLPDDDAKYAKAWNQLLDTAGFKSEWGLTTAERREPTFRTRGTGHSCEWDGAIWPFATSQTLRGLANLLTDYKHTGEVDENTFYDELHKYAWSQQMDGRTYIGEYQDEKTGYWLKGDDPRSTFYNHSTYMDLVINDLIGLKPMLGNKIAFHPLIPKGKWDYFYLDNVYYKGKNLTIIWDKTGKKYNRGKGFRVFADGKEVIKSRKLKPVEGNI